MSSPKAKTVKLSFDAMVDECRKLKKPNKVFACLDNVCERILTDTVKSPHEDKIINILSNRYGETIDNIERELKISRQAISKALQVMVEKGIVIQDTWHDRNGKMVKNKNNYYVGRVPVIYKLV